MLATGLLSGLLGAPTALAAETQPDPANLRRQIVGYWETGGAGIREAAEQALLGGDDAIRKFLDEAPGIANDDNRVDAARLMSTSGPGVREAIKAAWGSPAELEEFLDYGLIYSLDEDRKVDIARMVGMGGPGVRDEGKVALLGTIADREKFLAVGQYVVRKDDNRVDVARLTSTGGPNVKAAAKVALRGTPDDIVEFLEVGQFVARNRDQEYATISELTEQAREAGKQAQDATKLAEESSKKAVEASEKAKELAKKAAAETQAAKNDSQLAAVKAKQAADAARAAASAAQEAIGSANAANRAARRAALAATQTASAAAAAARAANNAYTAAIAAAGNAADADKARQSAAEARAAAQAATESAKAANEAGKASAAAGLASTAAKGAATNARAAADAADEANGYSDAAGGHSAEARQAAAEARRHANAADAAADRSAALAQRAATAAYGARDAANKAAEHAVKAAGYAEEAATQAGNAATYAAQAKKNADAAKLAAEAAAAAVAKAKETFAIAREGEAEDLKTRTDAAIERARSIKDAGNGQISASASSQVDALALNTTATTLAQEAARPDVDVKATAVKGRQLAMQAMKLLGPWHKEAAARALAGTDQDVLDYLRTRWKEAVHYDIRERVVQLRTQSPYAAVRTAAIAALKGTPAQIETFYFTGQYTAGLDDMKVDVARFTSTGGPGVKEAAKKALADGTPKALATFLNVTQYGERVTDEKVFAATLTNTGGPEVNAAAKIALAGSPDLLHEFVTTGQYMAQRKDDLATNHVNLIERLLAEGQQIAAKAMENRWRAAEAAARAQQASADADKYAQDAKDSAADADKYAKDAKTAADAAGVSAANAAKSATTARNAANRAEQDAAAAEDSAADAAFSASYARQSARDATTSANAARDSALAAGKSKEAAEGEARTAWKAVLVLREKEEAEARRQAEEARKKQQQAKPKRICTPHPTRETMAPIMACAQDPGNSMIQMPPIDPTMRAIVWELAGVNDVKECIENPTGLNCVMAAASFLPVGRLKLLTKVDDVIEGVQGARQGRRAVDCLASSGPHSFPGGTRVLMAGGASKPIEQIKASDLVMAADPVTGDAGPRAVSRTIRTPDDRNFTDVTLANGSAITSTDGHPYWEEGSHRWIEARDLRAGDFLQTRSDGPVEVERTSYWTGLQTAYDLTVDDFHTYYVFAGKTPVLVHNSTPCEIIVDDHVTYEPARNKALELLGEIDQSTRMPYVSRMEAATSTYGKVVGFTTRVNGEFKRFRMDWDPEKGPHINVEVGKGETRRKWAVTWNGSEADFMKLLDSIQ
ncbi:polymorphic toxin-type HINT domain-containing protein [Streptomyces sp. NBC_01244]|uniref:polymorphic toxin-type HINT domain-containing protein n=1 Tax=Streptomyces sp. NBC_01244 TaxID=2903797 RepID=UPI002E0E6924|nr:polymorphic toxin-type HINT domain-containing protein [Streptomyces sp. NBC_01244]